MDIFKSLGITLGQPTLSDSLDNLWKAGTGEGSRGGKIIGHTKSGKPIYSDHGNAGHAAFSANDHRDAMVAHSEAHKQAVAGGASKEESKAEHGPSFMGHKAAEKESRSKEADKMTFTIAHGKIRAALKEHGWDVKMTDRQGRGLKTPHATSPDGNHKLAFKPQSIYHNGHSLYAFDGFNSSKNIATLPSKDIHDHFTSIVNARGI